MSLDASGTIAGAITFSKWKGRNYVRQTVVPANPRSGLQTGMRSSMKFLTQVYAAIGAGPQGHWKDVADPLAITALNAMVRLNQARARANQGLRQDPTIAAGAAEAAPAGPSATAQVKSPVIAWTDSGGADDWLTWVYMSKTNGFTPDISNAVSAVRKGLMTVTIPGLESGVAYYFKVRGDEKGGTHGSLSAQFTGTPT